MQQVKSPSDVPMGHHYAVIIYKSFTVHTPGDERSRTNPGHGYPESTDTYNNAEHWITTDIADWKKFILNLEEAAVRTTWGRKDPYVFFEVTKRGMIEKTVTVKE